MRAYAVDTIERLDVFEALRSPWERLHAADPHAHVFTSWAWLRAYWETSPYALFIAAVRDAESGAYVAFAPFARDGWPARLAVGSVLRMGGNPKADYNGMVADPAHENAAVAALIEHLDGARWDRAIFDDVRDPRCDRIVRGLAARGRTLVKAGSTTCLSIELGNDFEAYLQGVTKRFRAHVRRSLRAVREIGATLEPATDRTIDESIETLLRFNHMRWRGNLQHARERFGKLYRNAYDLKCLQIFSLRSGTETLAAQAVFFCEHERSYLIYMTGSNPAYAQCSPGVALNALLIEHAIKHRRARYDFTRGKEPYKLRFGTQARRTSNVVIAQPGLRASAVGSVRGWQEALKGCAVRLWSVSKSLRRLPQEARSK